MVIIFFVLNQLKNVIFSNSYFPSFSELPPRPEPVPDFKTLLHCDTGRECPRDLAQCNSMLNPTHLGKRGYCVPQSCETNRDCPTVGDECGDGSISGTCNSGNCQYDPVLGAADCGKTSFCPKRWI